MIKPNVKATKRKKSKLVTGVLSQLGVCIHGAASLSEFS
jgi:hypothetical protein